MAQLVGLNFLGSTDNGWSSVTIHLLQGINETFDLIVELRTSKAFDVVIL